MARYASPRPRRGGQTVPGCQPGARALCHDSYCKSYNQLPSTVDRRMSSARRGNAVRVTYINGIRTGEAECRDHAERIGALFASPCYAFWNKTAVRSPPKRLTVLHGRDGAATRLST